ncbi:MAG TPA: MFS transporter, partial [Pseudolabrys sp.]|nr:MFS transporter [Pseudolabrys sp.]
MATAVPQGASSDTGQSSLAPFSHPAFSVLWAATVVSNIGTWMQNAAA